MELLKPLEQIKQGCITVALWVWLVGRWGVQALMFSLAILRKGLRLKPVRIILLLATGWLAHMLFVDWQRYVYYSAVDYCVGEYRKNNASYWYDVSYISVMDCKEQIKVGWGFSTQLHKLIKYENIELSDWSLYEGN